MKLSQITSPLLSSYMIHRLGDLDLQETKATCDNCLCSQEDRQKMIPYCGEPLPYYDPELKCCTFHPWLPNFAVGAILSNDQTSIKIQNILKKKIHQRECSLPLGVFAPIRYQNLFNHREPQDFGQNADFLCPYYDQTKKNCGLWLHRGSVCTSYYCVSDRGPQGLKLWEMLGDYMHGLELSLAQDCMVSIGLSPDLIDLQMEYFNCQSATQEEMTSDSISEGTYNYFWKEWSESPEEFYLQCYRYANDLAQSKNLKTFSKIVDESLLDLEEEIKKIYLSLLKVEKK